MCCNQQTQTYRFFPNIGSLMPNHLSIENGPFIWIIGVSLACMFISLALEHRSVFSKHGSTLIVRLITIVPKKFNLLLCGIFGCGRNSFEGIMVGKLISQQFHKKDMRRVEDIWDLGLFKDFLAWSKVQEKF